MKMKWIAINIVFCFYIGSQSFSQNWRTQATLEVDKEAVVESILPPELVYTHKEGLIDLTLQAPDGNPRPFELYMKEKTNLEAVPLKPKRVELNDKGGFTWLFEDLKKAQTITDLRIQVKDRSYVGQVTVEGQTEPGKWVKLAENQAIYRVHQSCWASIDIPDQDYTGIRLTFHSYDKKFDQKVVAIESVTAFINPNGKPYAQRELNLTGNCNLAELDRYFEIKVFLPGMGLNVTRLDLQTQVQFKGSWEAGIEEIAAGKRHFKKLVSGQQRHIQDRNQPLELKLNRFWPGKVLVLRLKPDIEYLGAIEKVNVTVRLPRIVFKADLKGPYLLQTGHKQMQPVFMYPGDLNRRIDLTLDMKNIESNLQYSTKSLIEEYKMQGAHFQAEGYTWRSIATVSEPGYYKMKLNTEASLNPSYYHIRLVHNQNLVPFVYGRKEMQTLALKYESQLDSQENRSALIVTLPFSSENWQAITLQSEGIFNRTLQLYKKKPGNMGWESIQQVHWQNKTTDEAYLKLRFPRALSGQELFKIEIDHGDNQPIEIHSIKGSYLSPTLLFLAHQAGEYAVFGGNNEIGTPSFDLSLVRKELMNSLPNEIEMGPIEKLQQEAWKGKLIQIFDSGWGLYLILGLVTLLLIGLIVKLFPKMDSSGK